jgi:hypothetical protein
MPVRKTPVSPCHIHVSLRPYVLGEAPTSKTKYGQRYVQRKPIRSHRAQNVETLDQVLEDYTRHLPTANTSSMAFLRVEIMPVSSLMSRDVSERDVALPQASHLSYSDARRPVFERDKNPRRLLQ